MNIQDLKVEVKGIKKEYNDLYVSIIDFSELMISKGYSLDRINYSSKSISTYIDYSIDFLDENGDYDCSEIITLRYSDHHATGNYGMTDVYFGSHLTLDENFKLVLEVIKERRGVDFSDSIKPIKPIMMGKLTEELRLSKIETAKKYLESQGYFTANLWNVDDVKQSYDVSDEEALDVLEDAMTSDWVTSQIFEAIDIVAEEEGHQLLKKEE